MMYDVAFSCDDGGATFLRVAVGSLLAHWQSREPLRVNVITLAPGHSESNRAALAAVVQRYPFATLRYIDAAETIAPYRELIANRANSRWNIFTWTPVFAPLLIPDATGNLLHLDIDMLVVDDVTPLLKQSLGNNVIAAVAEYDQRDAHIAEAVWGRGILPKSVPRYFNTGTIVFNLDACRAERTWERIMTWYREHYDIADRIEQDAWNALYYDRTQLLPLRWNFHDRNVKNYAKWPLDAEYWLGNPPRECLDAVVHPAILHFWGPKKPWKTCHRPFRRAYHAVMRDVGLVVPREPSLAPWYNFVNALNLWKCRRRLATLAPQ